MKKGGTEIPAYPWFISSSETLFKDTYLGSWSVLEIQRSTTPDECQRVLSDCQVIRAEAANKAGRQEERLLNRRVWFPSPKAKVRFFFSNSIESTHLKLVVSRLFFRQ